MAAALNTIMNGLFDALCFPFQWAPPLLTLTVISLIFGIVLLLLFKYTSPQETIKKTKERLYGTLYEIRLFKDDIGVLTKAIGRLMRDNGIYLACASVAIVPMVIIVLPVLFQLDARFGFAPFQENDQVIMNVKLAEGLDPTSDDIAIELPSGVELEAGPVRVQTDRELVYRLRVKEKGAHEVGITVAGERYDKRLDATDELNTVSPSRFKGTHTLDAMMFPAEKPWPDEAKLESVTLTQARASMLGMDGDSYPWLIIFCVVGLLFGFAMKGVFNVNI